jgi:hypothetical protein
MAFFDSVSNQAVRERIIKVFIRKLHDLRVVIRSLEGFRFWSGSLLSASPGLSINRFLDGTIVDSYTWTGSSDDGTARLNLELGSSVNGRTSAGSTNKTNGFLEYHNDHQASTAPMFAMSEELTVVTAIPEIDPAGMGSVLALVAGALTLIERRRLKNA